MADKKADEQDSTLTNAARTVGAVLGTVASAVNEIVGSDTDKRETDKADNDKSDSKKNDTKKQTSGRTASRSPRSARTTQQQRAHDKVKAKRAKHRRKLGRKTRG